MTNFPKKDLKIKETKKDELERVKSENTFLRQEIERLASELSKILNVLNPFK